jgi:hypothetical protein
MQRFTIEEHMHDPLIFLPLKPYVPCIHCPARCREIKSIPNDIVNIAPISLLYFTVSSGTLMLCDQGDERQFSNF